MANILKQFLKERDEAVRSLDLDKFKAFYEKWKKKGYYRLPLPSDEILERSMRIMILDIKSSTDEEKAAATEWLEERRKKDERSNR